MQAFGLRRAGLILVGVLVIGLAITAVDRARRPRVVVTEGPSGIHAVSEPSSLALPTKAGESPADGFLVDSDQASEPSASGDMPGQPVMSRAEPTAVTHLAIVVHVAGAVVNPGVYSLAPGARVSDALSAAGGAAKSADTDCINLALPVRDGEQVYVPTRQANTGSAGAALSGGSGQPTRPSSVEIVAPNRADITRSAPDPAPAPSAASAKPSGTGLININTASAKELEGLPGVGPVLAQRIVDYRSANGPFAAVEGLTGVSGIGKAKLEKIAPRATVR